MESEEIERAFASEYTRDDGTPFTSIAELKENSPEYAEAFARTGDPGKAIRQLASRTAEGDLNAWFLTTDVTEYEDDDGNTQRSVGPRILLPDGRTRKVSNGQSLESDPLTPVTLESVVIKRTFDFSTGEWSEDPRLRRRYLEGVKVQPRDHGLALPDLSLTRQIEGCFQVQDDPRDRGTIRGRTFWHVPAFVEVQGEDGVSFFTAEESDFGNEDTLRVSCLDPDEEAVRFKLDIDQVCETFGLDRESADRDDFATALADEPLFVYGALGCTYPIPEERLSDADDDGISESLRDTIEELDRMGKLTNYDEHESTGTTLQAVNFHGWFEDGEPMGALGLKVGDYVAYDIRETAPDEWEILVSCADQNNPNWMDVREHAWSNEEDSGIANEGAFVAFLNYTGGTLPNDDPAHQLALNAGLYE